MLANPGTGSNPNLKPIMHKEPLPGYSLPPIKTGKLCYWQILQTQLKRHQCVCLIAQVSKRKDWVVSLTNDIKLHQLHPRIDHWEFPLHHPTLSTATEALVSLLLWLALRLRQAECMLRWTWLRSALTWDRSRSVALFISVNWRRKETTALHRFSRRECSAEKYSLKDCSCNW